MKTILALFAFLFFGLLPVISQDVPLPDSIRLKRKHPQIIAYQFNKDRTSVDSVVIDTTLHNFELFFSKPFSEKALNVFLGNFSQPYQSVIYTNRTPFNDFLFSHYIEYNFHQPEEITYYKTWSPFTQLSYYSGGPRVNQEQRLNIIHTQNITKDINVGFLGDLNSGEGNYTNQRTKSNSFTLYAGYTGARYSIHGNVTSNKYKGQENGGMKDDSLYLSGESNTGAIPVNLEFANHSITRQTVWLNQRFYLTGSYKEDTVQKGSKWNEVVSVIHEFRYDRYKRGYTDDLLSPTKDGHQDKEFYNYSIGNYLTFVRDSSYFRRIENIFQLAINANPWLKIPAELRFGIKNQTDKLKYGPLEQQKPVYNLGESRSLNEKSYFNNALVGSLTNRFSKTVSWGVDAEIYFTGYKLGNTEIKGQIEKKIGNGFVLNFSGIIANMKPGYFINEYSSWFQNWTTSFPSQQTLSVHGGFYIRKLNLFLEGQIDNYNNFVYFGTDARPTTAGKAFSVQSLNINQLINWGVFHNEIRVSLQRSENEDAIQVPYFSGFNSTYVKFTVFKVLTISPGFDLFYNSAFYANAYMPETGMFYTQKVQKIGDYPFLNMFLNIKLKRFRFFIKYDRINTFLPNSEGFFAPHYPFNPSIVKYGLSWTFYD